MGWPSDSGDWAVLRLKGKRGTRSVPLPGLRDGWQAFTALLEHGSILDALEALHTSLGDVFRLPLPGFKAIVLAGHEANRFLLTTERQHFLWRAEQDPVTHLLGHGLLVEDGAAHDQPRAALAPAFHRQLAAESVSLMCRDTDEVIGAWRNGARIDVLSEMRHIALLVVFDTIFHYDARPQLSTLWRPIQRTLRYISPGAWLLAPGLPRQGYARALRQVSQLFEGIIAARRARPWQSADLVGSLIASGMSDALMRDQLLTLFIAGHDTSTAALSWTLLLLAHHPAELARAHAEIDEVLGGATPDASHLKRLPYLDSVIKESLRLYPSIHLGSRIAATATTFQGYTIPAGSRVLYSHYLTHRDGTIWRDPKRFMPERFLRATHEPHPAYAYVPFGGGARNCIGAAFAQVETTVVLARILQQFDLVSTEPMPRPRMRATLEPTRARLFVRRHD